MRKIVIRLNSSKEVGMGHFVRMLYLGSILKSKFEIFFVTNNSISIKKAITDKGFNAKVIKRNLGTLDMQSKSPGYLSREIPYFEKILKSMRPHAVILDILNTTEQYISMIKKYTNLIISFDNTTNKRKDIDLIINSLWFSKKDFKLKNVLVGHKYLLLRAELYYNKIKLKKKVKNVLIFFGGSDVNNYTLKVMRILKPYYKELSFNVIIGIKNSEKRKIFEYCKRNNLNFYYNINNINSIISKCDMALTSGGITLYELLCKGIPSIVLKQVKNEFRYTTFPKNLVINLEEGINVTESKILDCFNKLRNDYQLRKKMHYGSIKQFSINDNKNLVKIIKGVLNR